MEFAYDGGGLGKGGDVTLSVDGTPVGTGRVEQTQPFLYSMDETVDVGIDAGTPVSEDYTSPASRFTGTVNWVRLDAGNDSHDHMVDPEHLAHIAMTKQ